MRLGSWDQRQNPHPDHGHPFWGRHAGYPSGICEKLRQVIVHTHFRKYLHQIRLTTIEITPQQNEWFIRKWVDTFVDSFPLLTGRHIRWLQETPTEALWRKWLMHCIICIMPYIYALYANCNLHAMPMLLQYIVYLVVGSFYISLFFLLYTSERFYIFTIHSIFAAHLSWIYVAILKKIVRIYI